jgi:hypothetical protein
MVAPYIAGAVNLVDDRQQLGKRTGAAYRAPSVPWRVVWHKMEAPEDNPRTGPDEGWELDQSIAYICRHEFPPHLWALPLHDWVGQTVPLNLSAYALQHDAGDPETNHAHAVQIEVMGWSREGLDDPGLCDWLGRRVLGPIIAAGVPVNLSHLARSTGSDGYGEGGAVRFTWGQWGAWDGLCGHANVPGNDHWDPGVADYARIARAAGGQPQEDPMDSRQEKLVVGKLDTILSKVNATYNQINSRTGMLYNQAIALDRNDPSAAELAEAIAAELGDQSGGTVSGAEVEAALRRVFSDAGAGG